MSVTRSERWRIIWWWCPMLTASALLLVLPPVIALQDGTTPPFLNISSETTRTSLKRGISVTRILPDGELERIIQWPGICAKETIVNWGDTDVALRQVWLQETSRKLQLIYESESLTDCVDEVSAEDNEENVCQSSASSDDDYHDGTASIEIFDIEELGNRDSRMPQDLSWLSSTSQLRHQCDHLRSKARNQLLIQHRRSGRKQRRGGRSRTRRELLMVPGTQWCGRGHRATKYTNLGGFGVADACCRKHDTACPFYIPAFQARYGLFNWGISSMMHCACDERFRTCLKMAGTGSANFIGKIFFDVLRTKCFILKPQKVCTKRSWLGKCQHHEYRKQAHVRDNVPY